MTKTTTKRKATIGQQKYVNADTGEIRTFDVIEQRDVDFNFDKIWLAHMLDALNVLGSKKVSVLNYLMQNRDSKNQVIATQRKIAKELNVALMTVQTTMKSLQHAGAIKQVQQGVYMLSPDIVFRGGNSKHMSILLEYERIETE